MSKQLYSFVPELVFCGETGCRGRRHDLEWSSNASADGTGPDLPAQTNIIWARVHDKSTKPPATYIFCCSCSMCVGQECATWLNICDYCTAWHQGVDVSLHHGATSCNHGLQQKYAVAVHVQSRAPLGTVGDDMLFVIR